VLIVKELEEVPSGFSLQVNLDSWRSDYFVEVGDVLSINDITC
jgi:hypothetical protein